MQMDDLDDMLECARESNAEVGITGALVYADGDFLQILEGKVDDVLELMGRISRDVRHERVTVLKQGSVPAAVFSNWNMAYVSATPEQIAQWAGLSGTATVSDLFADMHSDPLMVAQFTERILSVLAANPDSRPGT